MHSDHVCLEGSTSLFSMCGVRYSSIDREVIWHHG